MYRNSVDALNELLGGRVSEGSVDSITPTIGLMKNGIIHCIVQVILSGGEEYRIEAYGEEAEQLWKAASERSSSFLCLY
jgi:hypothetical protein